MQKFASQRVLYLLGFFLTLALLGFGYYLENYDAMVPCPLCILQRFTMACLSVLFLLGSFFATKKWRAVLISCLCCLFAIGGIVLSARQVWIQHLPANVHTDCGASLQYLLHVLPWDQVVQRVFSGTAECAQVSWQFLHLSLAGWSLLSFSLLLILSFLQVWLSFHYKKPFLS